MLFRYTNFQKSLPRFGPSCWNIIKNKIFIFTLFPTSCPKIPYCIIIVRRCELSALFSKNAHPGHPTTCHSSQYSLITHVIYILFTFHSHVIFQVVLEWACFLFFRVCIRPRLYINHGQRGEVRYFGKWPQIEEKCGKKTIEGSSRWKTTEWNYHLDCAYRQNKTLNRLGIRR